jgi:hypothetical protein
VVPLDCITLNNNLHWISAGRTDINYFAFCGEGASCRAKELVGWGQHLSSQRARAESNGSPSQKAGSADENVTLEEVNHSHERVAQIDGEEAAQIVATQEADFIQLLNSNDAGINENVEDTSETPPQDRVFLLSLNRNPKAAMDALQKGLPLKKCRDALEDNGFPWQLPTGTLVFVETFQYHAVRHALKGIVLRSSDVIVTESLEYLVAESLEGCGQGCYAKSRMQLQCVTDDHSSAAASTEQHPKHTMYGTWDVKRTFIWAVSMHSTPPIVTKSTTDADSRHGVNPRSVPIAFTVDP